LVVPTSDNTTSSTPLELVKFDFGWYFNLGYGTSPGDRVKLLDGRYGPYVTDGTTNASLGKDENPDELTLPRALELLAARASKGPAKKKPARRSKKRRKAKKTPEEKGPPGPYALFVKEQMPLLKAKGMDGGKAMAEIGRLWRVKQGKA
jgi:topoisomerase IA-like protein